MFSFTNMVRAALPQMVRVRALFAAFAFLVGLFAVQSASAATFTVTNTNDSGAGSLRQAILNANAASDADAIVFDATLFGSAQTINLLSALTINNPVTITGTGARLLTVRRNTTNSFAIFTITSGTVRISGMTISNGGAVSFGAGVTNQGGTVTLDGVAVSGTVAGADSAVDNRTGTMTILNSLISNNSAAGLLIEGGTTSVANTTISGNVDRNLAVGGVVPAGGTLNLNNVTVTNNQPFGANNQGTVAINVRNTIIAGNTQDISGAFVSNGNNLIGSTTGGSGFTQPTDKTNVAANLAPLANNGGQTNTHSLNTGSPAIDAGNNCVVNLSCGTNNPPVALTTDQRGAGFARQQGASVDIGAFEVQPAAPTAASVTISGRAQTSTGRGIRNVLIRLTDGEGHTRFATTTAFGYYHFADVNAGETVIITAKGKRFEFSQPTQVLNINEDTDGVNFIANPN